MACTPLRDFLYLDVERLRSYLAQLAEGVAETRVATSGTDAGMTGSLEGGVPMLTKAAVGVEYLHRREQAETKSLHHYQYSLFESSLLAAHKLMRLDAASVEATWPPDVPPGGFVRAVGSIRLLDYAVLKAMLSQVDQMKEAVRSLGWLDEVPIGADEAKFARLSEMIDPDLATLIRAKLSPSSTHPERILAGVVNRSCLQWTPAEVRLNARTSPQGTWVLVGQVNPPGRAEVTEGSQAMAVGNVREDQLDRLAPVVDSLYAVFDGLRLPCVSVNLIAIYREC